MSPRRTEGVALRLGVMAICFSLCGVVAAGEADIVEVEVRAEGNRTFHFEVTVVHADTGWEHYADRWDIVAPDGTVLASRVLLHPHVDEQPFTRALGAVAVPEGVREVTVRAHDKVHGLGGRERNVALP